MSTSVADLLATLRADTSGFDGPITQSSALANQLGTNVGSSGSALSTFGDILGTVGGIAAGAFVTGLTAAITTGISFGSMVDQAKVSLQGFGESSTAAAANISSVVNMANALGQSQPAMLKASETLQALTGGAANNAATLTALAGAAATTQVPIQQLTSQIGYLYQAFGQGDTSIGFMGRVLVREGLIPQSTLDQVTAMTKAGVDINTTWGIVMSTLAGGSAAAQQYAGTLSGLTQSVKGLLSSDMGMAFQPVYDGIKQVATALKDLLSSPAIQAFAKQIGDDLTNLLPKFSDLASSITHLSQDAGSLTSLIGNVKELVPLMGVLGGLAVGSGVGILGDLPLIGAALGPLTSLLGPLTLGLAGFLATSAQTRDAVMNLASAAGNLLSSLAPIAGAAASLLGSLQPIAADVINITASIINFVASSKQLLDSLLLLGAAYIAFSVWEKASAVFLGISTAMRTLTVSAEEVTAAEQLQVVAGEELSAALGGVAAAQERLTIVQEQNQAAMISTNDYWLTAKVNAESLALAETQLTEAQLSLNVAMESGVAADAAAAEAAGGMGLSLAGLLGPIGLAVGAFALLNAAIPKSMLGGQDLFGTVVSGWKEIGSVVAFVTPFLGTYIEHMKQVAAQNREVADSLKQFQGKIDTSSLSAIQAAADASTQALKNLQAEKHLIDSGQVDVVPGGASINSKEIGGLTPIADQDRVNATNASDFISSAMTRTGASMKQVQDEARKLHVDLTQAFDTTQGQDNMDRLVGGLASLSAGITATSLSVNQQINSLKAEITAFDELTKTMTGAGGAQTFTVPTMAGADPQLAAVAGQTFQTKDYADAQLKSYEAMVRSTNQSYQLAQALDVQADAQTKLAMAQHTQADALSTLNAALDGETVKYGNLRSTLDLLTPAQAGLGAIVAAQVAVVQQLQNTYDGLNHTYTQQSNQLQILTDQQKIYQDILNRPLVGQSAMSDAQHSNKLQQAGVQEQIDTLELAGVPTMDQRVVLLTEELDLLKKKSDLLTQQNDLTIGDEQYKIQQAQQGSLTTSYQAALDAANALGKLKDQTSLLQQQQDNLKPSLDAAKNALDQQDKITSQAVSALQALASSDTNVTSAQDALTSSIHGVQAAHQAMTQQVLQDNLNMTNSIMQYVAESKAIPQQMITDLQANINIDMTKVNADFGILSTYSAVLSGKAPTPGVPFMATGGITQGPVIAGEGNPAYSEFVIPTDPVHRGNALSLYGQLGSHLGVGDMPGLAAGGIVSPVGHFAGFGANTSKAYSDTTSLVGNVEQKGMQGVVDALDAQIAAQVAALQAQSSAGSGMGGPGYAALTSWLGIPYLWGGGHGVTEAVARAQGVDCSGLVDQVYGQTGNTSTQIRLGMPVPDMASSLPGDLVFFGLSLAVGEPHHVGILTQAGGGQMIDAPHTGTVVRYDTPSAFGSIDGIRRWPGVAPGAGGTPYAGGAINNPTDFAMALLSGLGDPTSAPNVSSIVNWENREGGNWHNTARFNPLNTTMPEPGYSKTGTQGNIGSYISWAQGLKATEDTLNNGLYGDIDAALHAGIGLGHGHFASLLKWSGGGYDHLATGGVVNAALYDQGGWLPPGLSLALNNTGGPERILGPGSSAGGGNVTIQSGAVQVSIIIPPGMSIPAELTAEIESTVSTALEHVMASYNSHRSA